MTDHITTELAGGVLTVALNRPEKKNAITQAMYAALTEATERARTDDAVRVLLFRAEGDSFSAGNDIGDFIAIGSQTGQPFDMAVFRFLKALADLDKPAVAAVRGRAVGIGLTLLLHCDMVVVAEDALLSAPFVNLALAPEAASSLLLPQAVGHQRAFEIFALGEPIDGRTALAWGLANRAVPRDEFEAAAGHVLMERGQAGTGVFIIEDGSVRVEMPDDDDDVILGPGEFVGELSVLADTPRTARVMVDSDMTGLAIRRQDLDDLLLEEPTIAVAMLRALARRCVGHD